MVKLTPRLTKIQLRQSYILIQFVMFSMHVQLSFIRCNKEFILVLIV